MAAIATWLGFCLASQSFVFNLTALVSIVSVFLICGAGQAINDYFDRDIDKKINSKRPIPSGAVKAEQALLFSLVLFLVGIILASFINAWALIIAIIFAGLLVLYSGYLKHLKFFGNWIVALGTAFTFPFGAASAGMQLTSFYIILIPFASALFSNVAREITKDLEDFEKGEQGKKILRDLLGFKSTKLVVVLVSLISILVLLIPFFLPVYKLTFYLPLVAISILISLFSINLVLKDKFKKAQKFDKIAMLVGLIAFLSALL